jgi:3-hydroxybutyryl-CoA dehydratase
MGKCIRVGDRVTCTRCFGDTEVRDFATISGDYNPVHLDDAFAQNTIFGRRIIHGMLAATVFSALLGGELPGPGSIYLGQTLNFRHPMFLNEELLFVLEVTKIREDKPIISIRTLCENNAGRITIEGEATIKFDDLQRV